MEKVLFKEEQRMHHPRMVLVLPILFFIIVTYIIGFIIQLKYRSEAFFLAEITNNEFVIFGVILFFVLGLLLAYSHICHLKTIISSKGICLSYPPFHKTYKKIDLSQIRYWQVRRYDSIREYYGHGKRNHRLSGKAYTISGNFGLQLYFKNGKKLLIGTQKKQAIKYAMEKLMNGNS